jgi:hypothetical protein
MHFGVMPTHAVDEAQAIRRPVHVSEWAGCDIVEMKGIVSRHIRALNLRRE